MAPPRRAHPPGAAAPPSLPATAAALIALAALLLADLLAAPPSARAQEGAAGGDPVESDVEAEVSDTVAVIKEDTTPGTAEIAVRLSEATAEDGARATVLIGRDDEFADAMSSAFLQRSAPLLLVPQELPLPDRVVDEIDRLGATDAVLLGGQAALPESVAQAIRDLGLAVERREGPSRFETAIDIAVRDAADVDTVILARAFPDPDAGDPTQAFADSIAAGGMAAAAGWPILLTQTEVLTGATRTYLEQAHPSTVLVVGGTAAISEEVTGELDRMGFAVQRVAGDSRAGTAVEIAKARGAATAAEAGRALLVDGSEATAWAAGFAAAHHSAVFDAPIVLSAGSVLPPETQEWLDGDAGDPGVPGGSAEPVLTCATTPAACEEAREAMRLPPPLRMAVAPADRSEVRPGQQVGLRVQGESLDDVAVEVRGDCVDPAVGVLDVEGRAVTTVLRDAPPGPCRVGWQVTRPGGTAHRATATYLVPDAATEPVQAAFAVSPRTPEVDAAVQLSDRSTGPVVSWEWDLGDGTTSTAQNPRHRYARAGDYRVGLRVSDRAGATSTATATITVVDAQQVTLVAAFTVEPRSPVVDERVTFRDASTGAVVGWEWDLGDGTRSAVQSPTHRYARPGDYRVQLRVRDRAGATATTSATFTVQPPPEEPPEVVPPVASFAVEARGCDHRFTDTSREGSAPLARWEWRFGDGVRSQDRDPLHRFPHDGEFTVQLGVEARDGGRATVEEVIRVRDCGAPPRG